MWWRLFLLQYKKLIDNKLLVIYMLGLYFLYFFLLFDVSSIINKLDIFRASAFSVIDYMKFPLDISVASWVASFLVPLWMIFVIIFLAQDWSGVENTSFSFKKKFFLGKLSFVYLVPFDWTLTALIGGLIMWLHWGRADINYGWTALFALWLQVFAYVSFAVLFVSLFKKPMASVLAFLGYFVLEAIVRKLLFSLNIPMGFYLPAKVITSLVVPPAAAFAPQQQFQDFFEQHSIPFVINALLAFLYSTIFLLISYKINFKKHNK